jgi:hypothetical protein
MLVISSAMDEAWQLLHHMRSLANPLLSEPNLFKYLFKSRQSHIQRIREVQRINGVGLWGDLAWPARLASTCFILLFCAIWYLVPSYALTIGLNPLLPPELAATGFLAAVAILAWFALVSTFTFVFGRSFYSTVWGPVRWLNVQIRGIMSVPGDMLTYVVRRRGWPTVQQLAFGLEGYKFQLPEVGRVPAYAATNFFRYEDLPADAQARALSRRGEWLGRHFGDVSQLFSQVVVSASDISELLKIVSKDLSLVHAAYYVDEECVERIAEWIATGALPESNSP